MALTIEQFLELIGIGGAEARPAADGEDSVPLPTPVDPQTLLLQTLVQDAMLPPPMTEMPALEPEVIPDIPLQGEVEMLSPGDVQGASREMPLPVDLSSTLMNSLPLAADITQLPRPPAPEAPFVGQVPFPMESIPMESEPELDPALLSIVRAQADLERNISSPTEAGTQQVQDYFALTRDLGIVPSLGNQGSPNALQIESQIPGSAAGGSGLVAPTPTGNAYSDWQEGQRYLGNLYGEKARLEAAAADELIEELESLVSRRANLAGLAADPRSGLDPDVLAESIKGVEDQIELLSKTAEARATSALGGINEQIARQEGRLQALRPEAEKLLREKNEEGDDAIRTYQAAAALLPTGESGEKLFNDMTPTQKMRVREKQAEWDNTQFAQQIEANPEAQRENDEAYIRYQSLKGGDASAQAFQDVSAIKQAAITDTLGNPDLREGLSRIQQQVAVTGDKSSGEAQTRALIQAQVTQNIDNRMRDFQLDRIQTDKSTQTWMVDPAIPETQQIVEKLPVTDGGQSSDEFVQTLFETAEPIVGKERASSVVMRMISRYNQTWGAEYEVTGLPSYAGVWYSSWMSQHNLRELETARELERADVRRSRFSNLQGNL